MKKALLCLGTVLLLISCNKDDSLPNNLNIENEQSNQKTLIINDDVYYAGYGYSPTQDRPFRPAIDSYDIFQSTDLPPTEIDVEVITDYNEFVDFVQRGSCVGFSYNVSGDFDCPPGSGEPDNPDNPDPDNPDPDNPNPPGPGNPQEFEVGSIFNAMTVRSQPSTPENPAGEMKFGIGFRHHSLVSDSIAIKEGVISVVARVKIPKYRYLVDGDPFLNDRALDLIDNGQLDRFVRKFGPSYVDDRIVGGEILYMFNFDFSEYTRIQREEYGLNAKISLGPLFGMSFSKTLSRHEINILKKSFRKHYVLCTVPGFIPDLISISDFQNEEATEEEIEAQIQDNATRLNSYLDLNNTLSSTIWMSLRPYSNLDDIQQFTEEYTKEMNCYTHWEQWTLLRAKVLYVFENTMNNSMKTRAQNALVQIDQNIQNSRSCNNSVAPNESDYSDIIL